MMKADLSTSVGSLKLRNPTIMASGILGEDENSLLSAIKGGAAAVVTKSIGLLPRDGHENPTVVELETGMLNALGLPNPGVEDMERVVRGASAGGTLIASIYGADVQDFVSLAGKLEDYGAHAIELNLSCPHVKGMGADIGTNPSLVRDITRRVKAEVRIPVLVKLTPNVTDITEIGLAAEEGDADGLVAINTVRGMAIDVDAKMPILSNRSGGYSGAGIRPIGVKAIYDLYEKVSIPLIGVGGISNGHDALEYIMAGARAVEIGTVVKDRGITVFRELVTEMGELLTRCGHASLKEVVGIAHKR